MKSYREELWFEVLGRRGFINITSKVEEALEKSGIQEGLCLVQVCAADSLSCSKVVC